MSKRSANRHRKLALAQVAMRVIFWALWFNGLLGLLQDAATIPLAESISVHRNNTLAELVDPIGHWKGLETSSSLSASRSKSTVVHVSLDSSDRIDTGEPTLALEAPRPVINETGRAPTNSSSHWWIVVTLKGGSHNGAFIVSLVFYGLSLLFALVDLAVMTSEAGGLLCCLACCCCHSSSSYSIKNDSCAAAGDMDSALTFSGQNPSQTTANPSLAHTISAAAHSSICCVCGSESCLSCHCSVCSSSTESSDEDDEESQLLPKPRSSIFHPISDQSDELSEDTTSDVSSEDENEGAEAGSNSCWSCSSCARRSSSLIKRAFKNTKWLVCYPWCGGLCRGPKNAQIEDGRNYLRSGDSKQHHRHHSHHHSCCCCCFCWSSLFSEATKMRLVAWIRCFMFLFCSFAVGTSSLFHWITLKGPHEPLCWLSLLVHLLSILALIACAPTAYCTSPSPSESQYRGGGGRSGGERGRRRFHTEFGTTSDEEAAKAQDEDAEFQATEEADGTENSDWTLGLDSTHPVGRFQYPYFGPSDDDEKQSTASFSDESKTKSETGSKSDKSSSSSSSRPTRSTFAKPPKEKKQSRGNSRIKTVHPGKLAAEADPSTYSMFSSRDAFFDPPTIGVGPH